MNLSRWFQLRKLETKIRGLLRQGIGQHNTHWDPADPDAEQKFLVWMEARRRMARRPVDHTLIWLRLVSVPEDATGRLKMGEEIQETMEEQGIQFTWEEYSDLLETFQEMFRKAKAVPHTGLIVGLLLDTGDLFEYSWRDVEKKMENRRRS